MPNRYIRESAIESLRVNSLSWQAEVFYRRLLNRVDDFGRFTAHPDLLRASIFPLQLDRVAGAEVSRLIDECVKSGLLSTYMARDGKQYLAMHTWEQGRAKESKYPSPPADVIQRMQTHSYTCLQPSSNVPDPDPDPDPDPEMNKATARHGDPAVERAAPAPSADFHSAAASRVAFKPPTDSELETEASRIGLPNSEAEKFRCFYESKGWMVGKNRMKSWRGALSGWKARWEEQRNAKATNGQAMNRRKSDLELEADAALAQAMRL